MPGPAHPKNVPGDFYVAAGCCTLCGVPRRIAPQLFTSDDEHCWVARQPATPAELGRMLQVLEAQERDCVRYRGDDPMIRLAARPECVDPRETPPAASKHVDMKS